jgi:hypothetical protein
MQCIGDDGALAIAEALEFNSSLQGIEIDYNQFGSKKLQLIDQTLEDCKNRQKQNARLWICSFIGHCRAEQRLNFDNLMLAFCFYPLLRAELSKQLIVGKKSSSNKSLCSLDFLEHKAPPQGNAFRFRRICCTNNNNRTMLGTKDRVL